MNERDRLTVSSLSLSTDQVGLAAAETPGAFSWLRMRLDYSPSMQLSRHAVVRRVVLPGMAVAFSLALAVRLAAVHQLSVARQRFEAEVAPLPQLVKPTAGGGREPAFIERLGGPAGLPDGADLARIRQLYFRSPSTWSPAELDSCRRFLAVNTALVAAADRVAVRRGSTLVGARGESSWWDPAQAGRLLVRAGAQTSLLKLRIRLALLDRSSTEVRQGMEALAAEVEALEAHPGVVFQLIGLGQEKGLLQAMAWVAEEPGAAPEDLVTARRLLPSWSFADGVRRLIAGEASYLLAADELPLADADRAHLLDGYRRLSLTLAQDLGAVHQAALRGSQAIGRPTSLPAIILALNRPAFEGARDQIAATLAARQIARLALDLRLAADRGCTYPATLDAQPLAQEPDPFTAHRPHYVRNAQGGALLSNPSAAAAWEAMPRCLKTKPPPYVWRLPAPCAPGKRQAPASAGSAANANG